MHPVSTARGESWFPATITTIAAGSACVRRANWSHACRIAGFGGRTLWKMSPASTTTSGASAITRSITPRKTAATSASRWLIPAAVWRWYWR